MEFPIHKSGILDAHNIQFIGIQHGVGALSIESNRVPTIAAQESPISERTDERSFLRILLASAGRLHIDHCSYALEVGLHERGVSLTQCGAPTNLSAAGYTRARAIGANIQQARL
jgi:hypothetical protein